MSMKEELEQALQNKLDEWQAQANQASVAPPGQSPDSGPAQIVDGHGERPGPRSAAVEPPPQSPVLEGHDPTADALAL